jgi:hypothetical protein
VEGVKTGSRVTVYTPLRPGSGPALASRPQGASERGVHGWPACYRRVMLPHKFVDVFLFCNTRSSTWVVGYVTRPPQYEDGVT